MIDLHLLASQALESHLEFAERARSGKASADRFEAIEPGLDEDVKAFGVSIQDHACVYGETFAWRSEMLAIALRAAASLNPAWAFHRSCLVAPTGYAFFEEPVGIGDGLYSGLLWNTVVEKPNGSGYDYYLQAGEWADDQRLGLMAFLVDAREPTTRYFAAFEDEPNDIGPRRDDEADCFMFVAAALELASQKIATVDDVNPTRPSRRRARAWRPEPVVRIIQLRRLETNQRSEEAVPVDWRCRWIVGGHWREQWFPSTEVHRPVWISPYIKGPEEKPLKLANASVFVVSR